MNETWIVNERRRVNQKSNFERKLKMKKPNVGLTLNESWKVKESFTFNESWTVNEGLKLNES